MSPLWTRPYQGVGFLVGGGSCIHDLYMPFATGDITILDVSEFYSCLNDCHLFKVAIFEFMSDLEVSSHAMSNEVLFSGKDL